MSGYRSLLVDLLFDPKKNNMEYRGQAVVTGLAVPVSANATRIAESKLDGSDDTRGRRGLGVCLICGGRRPGRHPGVRSGENGS
jgi:hypothetical protein